MSNNCLKAKSFILLLLMKSNRQKQRFCHPKMADLKAWSHGVRKANSFLAAYSQYAHTSEKLSRKLIIQCVLVVKNKTVKWNYFNCLRAE